MNHHEIENEEALWSVLARKIAEVSRPHGVLLAGRQNAQMLEALKNLDVMVCAESGSERTAGRAKENPASFLQKGWSLDTMANRSSECSVLNEWLHRSIRGHCAQFTGAKAFVRAPCQA